MTESRVRVERNIYRRPDGELEIGWRDAGGRQRWRVVKSGGIKAARAELAIELAKRAKGEQVPDSPRLTFRAAAESWWELRAVRNTRRQSQVVYRRTLDALISEFGSMRLSAITPHLIADYVAREQIAGYRGWTLKARITILGSVFKHATKRLGYTGNNPVALMDKRERPSTEDATPRRVLTDDELKALLDAFDSEDRLLFETIAETGLRNSEGRGLIWTNLDLVKGEITVDGQLEPDRPIRIAPKTKNSYRTIAISHSLAVKLREYRLATGRPGDDELVFRRWVKYGRNGRTAGYRAYLAPDVTKRIKLARKRAGLDPIMRGDEMLARAPVPHDLRHTHASRLIAAGWDVAEIAGRLGDTIEMVLKVYAHEWDAARRRADQRDRLEALYGSAIEAQDVSSAQSSAMAAGGEIVDLQRKR
jgi:integrase